MGFLPLFIRFRTSVTRTQELLDVDKEELVAAVKLDRPQQLVLREISFRYDDVEVLSNLSTVFRRGEATAVNGSSGKGKTTLIRILLSLIQADRGQVEVIGDHYNVALSAKHRTNFAYVPQGDKLFSGSIRDNLQYSENPSSASKLQEVLHLACAEFVYELPEGLDTMIGESGYGLSEGQAVRIAIARALL